MRDKYTIVVTGGHGFIGTNLCNRLALNNNMHVVAVDDLTCPSPVALSSKVQFYHLDVREKDGLRWMADNLGRIDEVYHLASIASPVWYKRFPMGTITTNIQGTENVCEMARTWGAKLLFSSTSEVYGDPEIFPQPESYNGNVSTLTDRACYDESKRCAETIIYEYRKLGLEVTIVRIFNTYGPGMRFDDGRVISEFIVKALENKPLTIYNGGKQTRSFCYINDMIQYLIWAMEDSHPGPINVGGDLEYRIVDIVKTLEFMLGKSLTVKHEKMADGDPKRRKPDLTLNRQILGYVPATGFDEGLTHTINYFKGLPSKWTLE